MRGGPHAGLAADDVCRPDATFCDLRKPRGNGLLLGFGHLLEEEVRTSIIGQPVEWLGPDCRLAAHERPLPATVGRTFHPRDRCYRSKAAARRTKFIGLNLVTE